MTNFVIISFYFVQNKLEEIDSAIGNCVDLTDLTLSSNNLQELPESIGNLCKLVVLRLDEVILEDS